MSNIYEKLAKARDQFHNMQLVKTGHNKFAGYKYFELGDFLIPAMGCLKEAGLVTLPVSFSDTKATMTVREIDGDGEIQFTSPMITAEYVETATEDGYSKVLTFNSGANLKGCHPIQNLGAVQTYQRRYLWVALMEIVEHDALDATTGSDKPAKATKKAAPPAKKAPAKKATVSKLKPPAPAPAPAKKAEPVTQKPVEDDFYLEDEGAAEEFAQFMITTAKEMHSGSVDSLVDFWKVNTHATDYLKEHYEAVYNTVVENFASLRQEVEGEDE